MRILLAFLAAFVWASQASAICSLSPSATRGDHGALYCDAQWCFGIVSSNFDFAGQPGAEISIDTLDATPAGEGSARPLAGVVDGDSPMVMVTTGPLEVGKTYGLHPLRVQAVTKAYSEARTVPGEGPKVVGVRQFDRFSNEDCNDEPGLGLPFQKRDPNPVVKRDINVELDGESVTEDVESYDLWILDADAPTPTLPEDNPFSPTSPPPSVEWVQRSNDVRGKPVVTTRDILGDLGTNPGRTVKVFIRRHEAPVGYGPIIEAGTIQIVDGSDPGSPGCSSARATNGWLLLVLLVTPRRKSAPRSALRSAVP